MYYFERSWLYYQCKWVKIVNNQLLNLYSTYTYNLMLNIQWRKKKVGQFQTMARPPSHFIIQKLEEKIQSLVLIPTSFSNVVLITLAKYIYINPKF